LEEDLTTLGLLFPVEAFDLGVDLVQGNRFIYKNSDRMVVRDAKRPAKAGEDLLMVVGRVNPQCATPKGRQKRRVVVHHGELPLRSSSGNQCAVTLKEHLVR